MMAELKNLRSTVCRAAGQAFAELFLQLGKSMEVDLEKVVALLLQKAADTNKFIRYTLLLFLFQEILTVPSSKKG